jgi:hypothetical protein
MDAKAIDADGIFAVFAACPNDPKTLILDVREHRLFKRGHINSAYNPRLASNGSFLADYSQSQYALPWSQDCWCVAAGVFGQVCLAAAVAACWWRPAHAHLHHSMRMLSTLHAGGASRSSCTALRACRESTRSSSFWASSSDAPRSATTSQGEWRGRVEQAAGNSSSSTPLPPWAAAHMQHDRHQWLKWCACTCPPPPPQTPAHTHAPFFPGTRRLRPSFHSSARPRSRPTPSRSECCVWFAPSACAAPPPANAGLARQVCATVRQGRLVIVPAMLSCSPHTPRSIRHTYHTTTHAHSHLLTPAPLASACACACAGTRLSSCRGCCTSGTGQMLPTKSAWLRSGSSGGKRRCSFVARVCRPQRMAHHMARAAVRGSTPPPPPRAHQPARAGFQCAAADVDAAGS